MNTYSMSLEHFIGGPKEEPHPTPNLLAGASFLQTFYLTKKKTKLCREDFVKYTSYHLTSVGPLKGRGNLIRPMNARKQRRF